MDTPNIGGDEGMKNVYRETPKEEAYWRLLDENREKISESARTVIRTAHQTAGAEHLVRNEVLGKEEYDEIITYMRRAAAELTDRECKLLAKLSRAALASSLSIDPDDETPAGFRIVRGDDHYFFEMVSDMVEDTLRGKGMEESRKAVEREPEDYSEISFRHVRRAAGEGPRSPGPPSPFTGS